MKKIISLLLAVVMVATVLCACASQGGAAPKDTTAGDTQKLPSYAGQSVSDYDSNGNLILTSSENRKVYPYESGYAIFTFNGESVSKILRVIEFEDEESAEDYLTSTARDQVEKGEIPTTMRRNGVYVVINVGFDPENPGIGEYYNKTKTQIIAEFETDEAEG